MVTDEKLTIRPLQDADWQRLPELFAAAFHRVQPFASLTDDTRWRRPKTAWAIHGKEAKVRLSARLVWLPRATSLLGATLITLPPGVPSSRLPAYRI